MFLREINEYLRSDLDAPWAQPDARSIPSEQVQNPAQDTRDSTFQVTRSRTSSGLIEVEGSEQSTGAC